MVIHRKVDGSPQKGCYVEPWQGLAARACLFLHDASSGFFDNGMATPPEFGQQG